MDSWRKEIEKLEEEERGISEEEWFLLLIFKTLLWLAGLGACFLLAWQASGGSVLLTVITLLFPLVAWGVLGWNRWALLLPISLIAVLAMQAALLVW
jgi:hypothetical protein